MKVFNLTDIETPDLRAHGLVNRHFAVGKALLAPGESAEVPEERLVALKAGIQSLVKVGAIAVGDAPPAAYAVARTQASGGGARGGA